MPFSSEPHWDLLHLAIPSRVAECGNERRLDNQRSPFPSLPFRASDVEAIRTLCEVHSTEPDVESVRISPQNGLVCSAGGM